MIALAVPLTRTLGILGLCLGLLAGRAVQSIAYPLLVRGFLDTGGTGRGGAAPRAARAVVRLAAITALLFAAALALGQRLLAPNWAAWAAGVALTAACCFGVALWSGPSPETRRAVLARLRALWPGPGR